MRSRRFPAVAVVLVAGATLTIASFLFLRRSESDRMRADFDQLAVERSRALQETLREDLAILEFLGLLYRSSERVTREEFRAFVEPALADHPEIQAFEWIPRVPFAEREDFADLLRAGGLPGFEITVEAHRPPVRGLEGAFFPIAFVEPADPNSQELGTELASDPVAAAAMERASRGQVAVSARIALGEQGRHPGVRAFLPLFSGIADPRGLTGFVSTVLRIDVAVDRSFEILRSRELDLLLTDESTVRPGQQLHILWWQGSGAVSRAPDPAVFDRPLPLRHVSTFKVADRTWSATFLPAPAYLAMWTHWESWTVLVSGLLLTALLALNTGLVVGRATRVEDLVSRRTGELAAEVAEHGRTEAQLREALKRAQESDRLKEEFLANLSHEVATPLNAIQGFGAILGEHLNSLGDHSQDELVAEIDAASARLIRTVSQVLDYSRILSDTYPLNLVPLDVGDVVRRESRDFGTIAENKGLVFSCNLPEEKVVVRFDEHCLASALRNLLDNAVKFTRDGSVTVELRREGPAVLLEIRDTGIGIDEGYLTRLFRPFSQEDSGATRPFEGAGMGLALAKKLLELNGAELTIESRKGSGTSAMICFGLPSAAPSSLSRRSPG